MALTYKRQILLGELRASRGDDRRWARWLDEALIKLGAPVTASRKAGCDPSYLKVISIRHVTPSYEKAAAIGRLVDDEDGAIMAAGYLPEWMYAFVQVGDADARLQRRIASAIRAYLKKAQKKA